MNKKWPDAGKQREMCMFESLNVKIAVNSVITLKRDNISILFKARQKENNNKTSKHSTLTICSWRFFVCSSQNHQFWTFRTRCWCSSATLQAAEPCRLRYNSCHRDAIEACGVSGVIAAFLAPLPFRVEWARAQCCVSDPGGLALGCGKRRWLQPGRWGVSILRAAWSGAQRLWELL